MQIDAAFYALLNGSYVEDPTIIPGFVQSCQLNDPKAYLDNLQSSLTADGELFKEDADLRMLH